MSGSFSPSRIVAFVIIIFCAIGDSSSQRERSHQDWYDSYDHYDSSEPKNQRYEPKNQRYEPKNQRYESKNQRYEPKNQRYDPYRLHSPYSLQTTDIQLLHLDKGDYCRRSRSYGRSEPDYVCRNVNDCVEPLTEAVKSGNYLDVCSFDGSRMVVCCPSARETLQIIVVSNVAQPTTEEFEPAVTLPPNVVTTITTTTTTGKPPTKMTRPTTTKRTITTKVPARVTRPTTVRGTTAKKPPAIVTTARPPQTTVRGTAMTIPTVPSTIPTDNRFQNVNTVVEKCRQYNRLLPTSHYASLAVGDGTNAKPLEFPHMALLGYGVTTESRDDWRCGGSLINERWILTAANCIYRSGSIARWARLGDFDVQSTTDFAQPRDYEIVEHVLHPDYKRSERYHDIALFQLDAEVQFSVFVRPICLNSDPSSNPSPQTATGWGAISTDGANSDTLMKVTLDIVPTDLCNASYFSDDNPQLKYGITEDSMICGAAAKEDEDACQGFSGSPLQTRDGESTALTYIQYGITSFGSSFCGVKENPGVYTRVAKYVPWIEGIIFWS